MTKGKRIAALIECLGIAVIGIGAYLEVTYGGATHLVVITVGAGIVAIGSLIYAKLTPRH